MRKVKGSSQEVFGLAMKTALPRRKGRRPGGAGLDQRKEDQDPSGGLRGEMPPVTGRPTVEARRFVKSLPKEVKELMDVPWGQRELVRHGRRVANVLRIGSERAQGVVLPGVEDVVPSLGSRLIHFQGI